MKNFFKSAKAKLVTVGAVSSVALATQAQAIEIDIDSILADITTVGSGGIKVVLAIVGITVVISMVKRAF